MIAHHARDFTWNRGCSSNSPPLTHGDQIPHPLEDSDNEIPSSPGRQRFQMPGVCLGGMLKLRFDRYISSVNDNQQPDGAEHQAWRSLQFKFNWKVFWYTARSFARRFWLLKLKEGTMLFKHYKVQRWCNMTDVLRNLTFNTSERS